jgi:hypothetical protein
LQFVNGRREVAHGSLDIFARRFCPELYRDGFEVTVAHVHAMCHGADACRGIHESSIAPLPEDFQRFGFDLSIFATEIDAGNNIVDDVQRGHTRITRARQRLHRDDMNRL